VCFAALLGRPHHAAHGLQGDQRLPIGERSRQSDVVLDLPDSEAAQQRLQPIDHQQELVAEVGHDAHVGRRVGDGDGVPLGVVASAS
jgi:hypothetical protein